MKLRDKVWIWGHPENSLKGSFGIDKDSAVTPVGGMEYLGARNISYLLTENDKRTNTTPYSVIQKNIGV